jgi:hypothetical protein
MIRVCCLRNFVPEQTDMGRLFPDYTVDDISVSEVSRVFRAPPRVLTKK